MKKIKYFIPAFSMMIIIFCFSMQNGEESGGLSLAIVQFINSLCNHIFQENTLQFIVRKGAHMSEYGILALLLYYGYVHVSKHTFVLPLLTSFLYACSDELHQLFVSGRAGQFRDVMIDSLGALLFLCTLIMKKKRTR